MLNISYGIRDAVNNKKEKKNWNDKDDGIEMLKANKLRSFYICKWILIHFENLSRAGGDRIVFHYYTHDLQWIKTFYIISSNDTSIIKLGTTS